MNREMGNPARRSMNGEMYSGIRGEWVWFEVNVVDKESLNILIDEKVIAKNGEHAKGLTGVYDVLEDKKFDDTKLKIIVEYIASIRPIKEDEKVDEIMSLADFQEKREPFKEKYGIDIMTGEAQLLLKKELYKRDIVKFINELVMIEDKD